MKKILLLALALTLAGCGAFQAAPTSAPPTQQPTQVPPTAQVIVATVLVPVEQTVVVTKVVQPSAAPTDTLAPTLEASTLAAATEAPTQAAAPTATATASGGPIMLDDNLGAGFFRSMSYSVDAFSLRCLVKSVTFKVTAANEAINTVEFYYMIQDKNSIDISPWINGGNMLPTVGREFSLAFSAESIDPDWRRPQTRFSFQFVGISRLGQRVGGSERFINLISYTNDCPQ